MKISINTETEEIEELRHTVAIIEDAIKRRENPDLYEEEEYKEQAEKKVEAGEHKKEAEQEAEEARAEFIEPQSPQPEKLEVEEPKPQIELNLTPPVSYSQVEHAHQVQKPIPTQSRREERGTAADIDISALSMSTYGEAKEGRKMDDLTKSSNSSSSSFSSTPQSSSRFEPRGLEPRGLEPRNNESAVKDIISSLRNQRAGQPIQMSEIVGKARAKNISEQETRNLISKLQRERAI